MKKYFVTMFTIFLVFASLSISVHADVGPKSSINVHVSGFEGKYVITLLGRWSSSGEHGAGSIDYREDDEEHKVLADKLLLFEDGAYSIDHYEILEDDASFYWGYNPPTNFKVLIYSADKDEYYLSDEHSVYAFKSFFKAELIDGKLHVKKDYSKTEMLTLAGDRSGIIDTIIMFLFTLILTLLLELVLAIIFKYNKNDLILIAKVNVGTQAFLYLALSLLLRFTMTSYWFLLFFLEIVILIIELLIYVWKFENKKKAIIYSFLANRGSYYLGGVLLFLLFVG